MTLSIVDDHNSVPAFHGVKTSSRWFCDAFTGTADALTAERIITHEQLGPQQGRPDGRMVLLPNGEPCPPNRKAWREPGYKSIRRLEDDTYLVEVTVSKEVQAARRRALADEENEREQLLIVKEIEEAGDKYRGWRLRHEYSGLLGSASYGYGGEWWEGTKAQLQSVGIGVGMVFPGEPGGPEELHCKCPLGFDARVFLPSSYDRVKAAAGIYKAISPYVPYREEPTQYIQHAPGVIRDAWTPGGWRGHPGMSPGASNLSVERRQKGLQMKTQSSAAYDSNLESRSSTRLKGFDELPNGAFIRQSQLIPNVVPFSSATLWRKCKSGQFPKPVKLSERVTAWRVGDVRQFLDAQLEESV